MVVTIRPAGHSRQSAQLGEMIDVKAQDTAMNDFSQEDRRAVGSLGLAVVAEVTPLLGGPPTHRSQPRMAPTPEDDPAGRQLKEAAGLRGCRSPETPAARSMEGQVVEGVVGRLPGRRWLGAGVPEVAGEPEVVRSP